MFLDVVVTGAGMEKVASMQVLLADNSWEKCWLFFAKARIFSHYSSIKAHESALLCTITNFSSKTLDVLKAKPSSDSEAGTMYKLKGQSSNMWIGQEFKYRERVWSIYLICPAGSMHIALCALQPSKCKWFKLHILQIACVCKLHVWQLAVLQIAGVANCRCYKWRVLQIARLPNYMCWKLNILLIARVAKCMCCKLHMFAIVCCATYTYCNLHMLQVAHVASCKCCKLHAFQIACVAKVQKNKVNNNQTHKQLNRVTSSLIELLVTAKICNLVHIYILKKFADIYQTWKSAWGWEYTFSMFGQG